MGHPRIAGFSKGFRGDAQRALASGLARRGRDGSDPGGPRQSHPAQAGPGRGAHRAWRRVRLRSVKRPTSLSVRVALAATASVALGALLAATLTLLVLDQRLREDAEQRL